MFNRLVKRGVLGFLDFFLLMPLFLQLNAPDYAQAQTQNPLATKNVLILNAFESNVPAFEKTNQGLSAALQSGGIGIRNQFYEHLDLVRNPGPEHRKHLAELMRQRYGRRKIDFIITLYPEALKFLLEEDQTIFSDAPVLALYLPQGFEPPLTGRRIIVHLVIPDLKRTMEIALKLVPSAQRVYVVVGTHPLDRWLENIARQDFKTWEDRLEFRYLSDQPLEEILATVSNAPSDSIVFATAIGKDVTGKYQTTVEVSRQLARVSKAPVFGFLDTLLGHGIVGGSLVSFEYIGTRAGEMVLDILNGTRYAENTPIVLEVPQLDTFDWRQLRHWNLSESALPGGSIIVNKEFSLWDLRYYAVGVLAFIIAQSLLIAVLLLHRRRRRSAEESLRQKTEELDQFFSVSLDLLCIANTDGYFLRLNPVWEKVLGYTRNELMSKRFTDFVHPDDERGTREAVAALASQKSVTYFMNRYRCKNGTYRWLEWSAAPTGSLIYAGARDVTERKLADQALEERLRFERLLSDLSARFVNIPPDRVDSEIEYGLKQILEFFQVDRCGLVRTLPGRSAYQITHVAYSEDVPPVPVGVELPVSINPWAYEKMVLKRQVVAYSRLEDLPPEASVDKQTWSEWGIRSNVNIPILIDEPIAHIIAINSVKNEQVWPEELIQRLRLLGEIFVNALQRKQAEDASRETERILRQNESDLRRLAGRLIYAQEEERSRLARELHDDLAQRLAVFAIDVGRLEQQWVDPQTPVLEKLREIKEDVVKISQDVHSLSRQLHPSILDDLGLIKAVESECMNVSKREGIEILFNHENIPTLIPKDISLSLYRIIQEGLNNISKHACADHVSVSLKGINQDVFLYVQDDGIGFNSTEVKEKAGLGFSSMRERTRLIRGELSIQSQPEKGTLITVRVPLTQEEE